MKYKGYSGVVELDEELGVLFGQVIGLRDVITFQGESVAEAIQAFHDSVDDYLEFCEARGESPEKPYSGQFVLRVDTRLHRELANAALAQKTSLNALIEKALLSAFSTGTSGAKKTLGAAPKVKSSRSQGGRTEVYRAALKAAERAGPKGAPLPPIERTGKLGPKK